MDVMDLQMEGLMLEASPVKSEEGGLVVFSRPGSSDGDVAEIRNCVSERDLPKFKLDSTIWPMQPSFLNKSGSPDSQQQVNDSGNENENNTSDDTSDIKEDTVDRLEDDLGGSEPFDVSVDIMDAVEDIVQKCLLRVTSSSSESESSEVGDFDDTISRLLALENSFDFYDEDDLLIPELDSMMGEQYNDYDNNMNVDAEMMQSADKSDDCQLSDSSQNNDGVGHVTNGVESISLVVDDIADEEIPEAPVQMPQDESRLTVPEMPPEIYANFYPGAMSYLPEGLEEHMESVAVANSEDIQDLAQHYFDYEDSASDEDSITVTISPSASQPSAEVFYSQNSPQVPRPLSVQDQNSSSSAETKETENLEKKRVSFHEFPTEIEPSASSDSAASNSPPFCMGCAYNCAKLDEVTLHGSPNPSLRPCRQKFPNRPNSRHSPMNAFQPIAPQQDPIEAQKAIVKTLREEVIGLKFEVKSLQNRLREVQMDRERYQNACARLEKQLIYAFNFRDLPDAACMMREGPPMPPYMMMPTMRPMDPYPHPGYMPPPPGRPNFLPPFADPGFPRKNCPNPPPGMLQPMPYPPQDFSPRHPPGIPAPVPMPNCHEKKDNTKVPEPVSDEAPEAKVSPPDITDNTHGEEQGAAPNTAMPEEHVRSQFRNRSSSYGSNRFYNKYEGLDSHDWSKVRNSRRSLDGCYDNQDTMSSQGDYSSRGSRDRGRGRGRGRGGRMRGFGRGWSREGVRVAEAGKGLDRCWRSLARV